MRIYEYIANLRTKKMLLFIAITSLIIIDQLIKYLVRSRGGFYICNQGVAFGIELPQISLWLLITLSLISFLILNLKFKILSYPLIFILAGAISNIIDRIYFGCVIDFINPSIGPIFNLADVFISIGVIITLLEISNLKSKISKKLL